jgi:hypothetical protein
MMMMIGKLDYISNYSSPERHVWLQHKSHSSDSTFTDNGPLKAHKVSKNLVMYKNSSEGVFVGQVGYPYWS